MQQHQHPKSKSTLPGLPRRRGGRSHDDLIRLAHAWGNEIMLEAYQDGLTADEMVLVSALLARMVQNCHPQRDAKHQHRLASQADSLAKAYEKRVSQVAVPAMA